MFDVLPLKLERFEIVSANGTSFMTVITYFLLIFQTISLDTKVRSTNLKIQRWRMLEGSTCNEIIKPYPNDILLKLQNL